MSRSYFGIFEPFFHFLHIFQVPAIEKLSSGLEFEKKTVSVASRIMNCVLVTAALSFNSHKPIYISIGCWFSRFIVGARLLMYDPPVAFFSINLRQLNAEAAWYPCHEWLPSPSRFMPSNPPYKLFQVFPGYLSFEKDIYDIYIYVYYIQS